MTKAVFILKNEKGFTLLEAYIAFGLTLLIVSVIPLIVTSIAWSPFYKHDSSFELQVFYNQLHSEVRGSEGIVATENSLSLMINEEEVRYDLSSESIYRRVQGRGYVPMLDSVQSFTCEMDKLERLSCVTIMKHGYVFERSMSSLFSKVTNNEE
ncbi:ComGF family competence protein [Alkalicoccobacillus gibsonii]|uniref:ComGF family competence protein n=1 Tax=Alkalicoccobacillus gibsonii TaxID=79881 RepID=A0ABU9VMN2_9BACI